MDEASPLAIEGLALEMLAEVSRRSARPAERRPVAQWLDQVKEILHSQFSEPLKLSQIANSVNVHPVHIARTFRKHYHCTVGEYLRWLRLQFACRQLSTSDTTLAQVASQAGFSSQSHFSTAFKQQMGMTPAAYRAAFRRRYSGENDSAVNDSISLLC
jgi:AraC family transcriptional regulator